MSTEAENKAAVASAAVGGAAQARGGMEPPEAEKDLWQGNPSWKGFIPHFVMMGLWIAAVGAAAYFVEFLHKDSTGTFITIALMVVGVLFLFIKVIAGRYSIGYRLTTQRLHLAKGLLGKTYDQTELVRVDDVDFKQSFIQRLLGIGDVEVKAPTDRSDPFTCIGNIDDPAKVAELIRTYRQKSRQRGAVFVDSV